MRYGLLLGLLLPSWFLSAQPDPFELPLLWSDHMVIQRDQPVPLSGSAAPDANITVTLADQSTGAKADGTGNWTLTLPARPAGGPYTLTLSDGTRSHTLHDVYVGDVWLASGQSNMELTLSNANSFEVERGRAANPALRQFLIPKAYSSSPEPRLEAGSWSVATPETIGTFSAVGYHFIRRLHAEIEVPMALIHSSWGGSRIEAWMDARSMGYADAAAAKADLDRIQAEKNEAKRQALLKKMPTLPTQDEGMRGDEVIWAATDWKDDDWTTATLPGLWEGEGWSGLDGIVYLRRTVELPAAPTGEARIRLGKVDDADEVYVNGTRVGGIDSYNADRDYTFPASLLQRGKNVITVRVVDTGGGGGVYGAAEDLFLSIDGRSVPLAGTWKMRVGEVFLGRGIDWEVNQLPSMLYNRMIHPVTDFPIKGVIWYQGESNAGYEDAPAYAEQFQALIRLWRERWQQPALPFYWVQLANFMQPPNGANTDSNWAVLRESQSAALALPRTGEAVIIDAGEADDIHPRDKATVGERLAAIALADTYGQDDRVYSGPRFRSLSRQGRQLRLRFDHVGGGLRAEADRYGYLRGFAVAAADGTFHWARAYIDGDAVVVSSPEVAVPVAVRYAWADNPDDANLYNAEGFPASPFRARLTE